MKMMKKIAFAFVAAMLMVTMAWSVAAANEPTITVDTLEAEIANLAAGDEFDVEISISNNPGIVSMLLNVAYDEKLEIVAVNDSKFLGTAYTNTSNLAKNPFKLSWADDTAEENNTYNGTVFTFTFKLLEVPTQPQMLPVTVTYDNGNYDIFNKDTDTVDFDVADGGLNVKLKDMGDFTVADEVMTYDGREHSVADLLTIRGAAIPANATVTYVPETVKNVIDSGKVDITIEANGYDTEVLSANITINPVEVSIDGLKAENKVYDKTDAAVITGGTIKGKIDGTDVTANFPTEGTFASVDAGTRIAVSYADPIVLSGADADNYDLPEQPALTANITAAPVTIKAVNNGKLEGGDEPTLTYVIAAGTIYDGDDLGISVARKAGEAKGTYAITVSYDRSNTNYKVTTENGVFTISDKYQQYPIVTPDKFEVVFGDADQTITVTPDANVPAPTITYSSSNENVADVDDSGNVTFKNVGTAVITVKVAGNDTYADYETEVNVVVNKKELTVNGANVDNINSAYLDTPDGNVAIDLSKTTLTKGNDNGDGTTDIVLSNIVLTAEFSKKFNLPAGTTATVAVPNANIVTVTAEASKFGTITGEGTYLVGMTVTVAAKANSTSYRVSSLTVGSTKYSKATATFTATADVTVSADYTRKSGGVYQLPDSDNKTSVSVGGSTTTSSKIVLTIGSTEATVFGVKKVNDVAPIIVNDRTMLPARFVAEALGAKVEWDDTARKVSIFKDMKKIEIYIDSATAYINGEAVTLDSPAFIQNDRTYTPIRFIAESLGASVTWNDLTRQVVITRG